MVKKKITLENLAANLSGLTKTANDLAVNLSSLTKTVENLAQEMRGGFAAVDVKIKESEKRIIKDIDIKIDELAMITKHGFDSVDEQFKKVDERFDRMDERFDRMDERFDKLEKTNTREHEDISLRPSEVVYRFELVSLSRRVEKLEQVVGVRSVRQAKV